MKNTIPPEKFICFSKVLLIPIHPFSTEITSNFFYGGLVKFKMADFHLKIAFLPLF